MSESSDHGSGTAPPDTTSTPPQPESGLRLAFDAAFAADWRSILTRNDRGRTLPTLPNVYHILLHHEEWKGVICYDEFLACVTKRKAPPFGAVADTGEWTDEDDGRLALWLAQQFAIEPKDGVLSRAVRNVADTQRWHPVRDYLQGLTWDGTARVPYWLAAYLGARAVVDPPGAAVPQEETYIGKVGIKFLVGAVARVMKAGVTGVEHQCVLILEGEQGIGKSRCLKALAQPWFTDQQIRIGDKDTYETIRGSWVVELSELEGMNRAESSAAKAFFSRAVDRYRTFYGRRAASVPRQCVFAATANHYNYLQDTSGNRRFWPVRSDWADPEALAADRDQLWAEAFALYRKGVPWWVTPEEAGMFRDEQEARFVGDAYESRISSWLDGTAEYSTWRNEVGMDELLGKALGLDVSKWTRAEQTRVGFLMDRIGWRQVRLNLEGARKRVYRRPDEPESNVSPTSVQPQSNLSPTSPHEKSL